MAVSKNVEDAVTIRTADKRYREVRNFKGDVGICLLMATGGRSAASNDYNSRAK